ncbi:aminotransferase class III-fold pyridoxal phosphate-dependent enzyme [bacterium]|nr:aminotransferase class III-fold pyridoxal phosphate-dependent enzyme [bacterium]
MSVIPLGSQTFSKSRTQFPLGVTPLFVEKAKGSKVWDADGHEYIDFTNSLGAINLGYNDPDVMAAVKEQMEQGTIFSLSHPIEITVAEKLTEIIPCAEMVRFGKNGSDATTGAIRLARAYTGRDHILTCGYHGWHDWYIGTTPRNMGVPESTSQLSHPFSYNDIDSLRQRFEEHPNQVAAVIMEPMARDYPQDGFLQAVKEVAHANGALLIFDEMIMGFRHAVAGGQELFQVTPDLATFGKGIANGYPLSVICGKAEIMKLLEEIFFSFTFGGETLSLAASLATIEKIQSEPVLDHILQKGQRIIDGVNGLIEKHSLQEVLSIPGHPAWTFLQFKDCGPTSSSDLISLFMQEASLRNIMTRGVHTPSYAHTDADIDQLLEVYDEVFPIIAQAVHNGPLRNYLYAKPIEPLFKVR